MARMVFRQRRGCQLCLQFSDLLSQPPLAGSCAALANSVAVQGRAPRPRRTRRFQTSWNEQPHARDSFHHGNAVFSLGIFAALARFFNARRYFCPLAVILLLCRPQRLQVPSREYRQPKHLEHGGPIMTASDLRRSARKPFPTPGDSQYDRHRPSQVPPASGSRWP